MASWIPVFQGRDPIEVQIVLQRLKAAGVRAVIFDQSDASMFGGAQFLIQQTIRVHVEDAEEARTLIDSQPAGLGVVDLRTTSDDSEEPLPDELLTDDDDEPPRPAASADYAVGLAAGENAFAPLFCLVTLHLVLSYLGDYDGDNLYALGAIYEWPPPQEAYRFVVSRFIHPELLEIAALSLGLVVHGWALVELLGLRRSAVLYGLVAWIGGIMSALTTPDDYFSGGSAVCVAGLFGAAFAIHTDIKANADDDRTTLKLTGLALLFSPALMFEDPIAIVATVVFGAFAARLIWRQAQNHHPTELRIRLEWALAAGLLGWPFAWLFIDRWINSFSG